MSLPPPAPLHWIAETKRNETKRIATRGAPCELLLFYCTLRGISAGPDRSGANLAGLRRAGGGRGRAR